MNSEIRQDRLTKRKDEILAEATQLFAGHGYARAKVDDLALRLGVGKGTIYRYFPTKEALFLAAVDNAMEGLHQAMVDATQGIEDPFRKIEAAIQAYLAFFDANLHLIEIFVHERAEFRDRNTPTYLVYRDKHITNLERLLAELKDQGLVMNVDVKTTAGILGDTIYGTVHTHFLRGGRSSLRKLAPLIANVFFEGILTPAGKAARNRKG